MATRKRLEKAAKVEVDEAGTMKSLQKKLFPMWTVTHAEIFEKLSKAKEGMDDKSIGVMELMVLYPGAVDPTVNYLKEDGKEVFITHVEEWLSKNMLVEDMQNYSRMFMLELQKQIGDAKAEIYNTLLPEIQALKDQVKSLTSTQNLHSNILRKKDTFDCEIIVTSPNPEWDLTKPRNEVLEVAQKYLEQVADGGKLQNNSVVSVREIAKAKDSTEPRYSVIVANPTIRHNLTHKASNDENLKAKIRRGVPPHERSNKVKNRKYKIASAMFNWESQANKTNIFSRVEYKNGEPYVQKYYGNCPQVSTTKAKAEREELVKPEGFVDTEHRKLLSGNVLTHRA